MIKVYNGKTIRYLARCEYKNSRKRNLLTITAIIMTTFLITTICILGGSYYQTLTRRSMALEGMRYDMGLPEPTDEQIAKARRMPEIKDAGLSVKCAIIDGYQGKLLQIRLFWVDETCWEKQCLPAFEMVEGSYPENENEVMLSTRSLKEMGIDNPQVGMELPVTWGSLSDDPALDDCSDTFRLSGYYREYSGNLNGYVGEEFYKKTGVKQTDIMNGMLNLTLTQSLYSSEDIEHLSDSLELSGSQILHADGELFAHFIKMMVILGFLLLLFFISGYLFIYNILYIAVTKEIRHYGQLKTLGMTGKQMKGYVKWQILWNVLTGIPAGLVLGILTSLWVVPILINGLSDMSEQSQSVAFHPLILAVAAIFTLFVVWSASYQPLKLVNRLSPIEAVRFTGAGSGVTKRERKNGAKILYMAWWNIFRNKKQAVVSLASLFVVMVAFLIVNVALEGNSAKDILNSRHTYDFRALNPIMLDETDYQAFCEETIEQIASAEGVQSIRKVYSQQIIFPYGDPFLDNYFKRLYKEPIFSEKQYEEDMAEWKENPDAYMFTGRLVGIDENGFDLLNEKMGNVLDKEDFLNEKTAILSGFLNNSLPEETIGQEFSFRLTGEETERKVEVIAESTGYSPNFLASGLGPSVIINEQLFKKIAKNPIVELVEVDYAEPFSKKMDEKLEALIEGIPNLMITSKMDDYEELYQTEMQMFILGNSLCLVLACLALLNFGNMMAASIQNRHREFATLSSIGMTRDQIKKMVAMEGIGYVGIAVGLMVLLGVPLSYLVFEATNTYNAAYRIPVPEILLFVILILLCCVGIPVFLYEILQKGSIVEQLRK